MPQNSLYIIGVVSSSLTSRSKYLDISIGFTYLGTTLQVIKQSLSFGILFIVNKNLQLAEAVSDVGEYMLPSPHHFPSDLRQ